MKISNEDLEKYRKFLMEEEKADNTISKYIHDINVLKTFLMNQDVNKELIIEFKEWLIKKFKPASVNSMIGAVNHFLKFKGLGECVVRQIKIQREAFITEKRELTKNEYFKLVKAAYKKDEELGLVIETIGCTGIRVSELKFLTVGSLSSAEFSVSSKGKMRRIMLTKEICQKLKSYCKRNQITQGSIFKISRTLIWKKMKKLSNVAGVMKEKIFPHNLRHLFAKCFYEIEKDIAKLADILGHSNINTTHIYLISSGKEHRLLLEKMELVTSET